MLKLFAAKLLIKLIGIPDAPLPDEKTEDFLAECWANPNMKKYLSAREKTLEKYLARGIGIGGVDERNPLKSVKYILGFGQLTELANFTRICRNAYEAKHNKISTKAIDKK